MHRQMGMGGEEKHRPSRQQVGDPQPAETGGEKQLYQISEVLQAQGASRAQCRHGEMATWLLLPLHSARRLAAAFKPGGGEGAGVYFQLVELIYGGANNELGRQYIIKRKILQF